MYSSKMSGAGRTIVGPAAAVASLVVVDGRVGAGVAAVGLAVAWSWRLWSLSKSIVTTCRKLASAGWCSEEILLAWSLKQTQRALLKASPWRA